jgi:hypothetical protein
MLTIVIETDNAAFEDESGEVQRILRKLADEGDRNSFGPDDFIGETVRDINGNTVCRVYGQLAGVPKP